MKEVRPTFFLGVPVLIEGLYKKIWKEIRKQGKENSLKKILAVFCAATRIFCPIKHSNNTSVLFFILSCTYIVRYVFFKLAYKTGTVR